MYFSTFSSCTSLLTTTVVNELTSASQIQEWAHYNSYDINIVSQCAFPISFVVKQHGQQLVY